MRIKGLYSAIQLNSQLEFTKKTSWKFEYGVYIYFSGNTTPIVVYILSAR